MCLEGLGGGAVWATERLASRVHLSGIAFLAQPPGQELMPGDSKAARKFPAAFPAWTPPTHHPCPTTPDFLIQGLPPCPCIWGRRSCWLAVRDNRYLSSSAPHQRGFGQSHSSPRVSVSSPVQGGRGTRPVQSLRGWGWEVTWQRFAS